MKMVCVLAKEDCGKDEELYWSKFEGNFIRNMYDLCIMGDRYNPYYDGMAILGWQITKIC